MKNDYAIENVSMTLGPIGKMSFELCKNCTVLYANTDFSDLIQYKIGDILGRCYNTFLELSYKQFTDFRSTWSRLQQGNECTLECRFVRPNGSFVPALVNYQPVLNESGLLVKVKGYISAQRYPPHTLSIRMSGTLVHLREFTKTENLN